MDKFKILGMAILFGGLLSSCTQENPADSASVQDVGTAEHFVSAEKAVEIARAYVVSHDTRSSVLNVSNIETLGVKPTRSGEPDDDVLWGYYVINFENNSGFALVSADSRNMPVYAFSDEGSLNLSDTINNPGLREYISGLPYSLPASGDPALEGSLPNGLESFDPGLQPSPITRTKEVPPLLYHTIRMWSQWAPFNKYCLTPSGQQSVVGCVPLSTGMIMSYYDSPTEYKGYSFDWSEMKRRHASDDLARLLWVLGLPENLNTKYMVGEEQTSEYTIPKTYVNMGYKNPDKSNFVESKALEIIRGNNPIQVVGGGGTDNIKLHAWVVDGLYTVKYTDSIYPDTPMVNYSYYFHCVWGWGGKCNGYYSFANNKVKGPAEFLEGKDPQGFEESIETLPDGEYETWSIYYNFR